MSDEVIIAFAINHASFVTALAFSATFSLYPISAGGLWMEGPRDV